jgi:hypothetical protein
MTTVKVDFSAVRASVGVAVWRALPYGGRMTLRPMVGLTAAAIEGEIARDLTAYHEGQDVIGRYGYDPADVGLLGDPAIIRGWSRMHLACIRAAALLEEWNLVDGDELPIPITEPNIQQLFQLGPFPGSGAVLLSAFNRLVDAPLRKVAEEKKGSPPPQNGGSAAELSTAPPVDLSATPAQPADA